MKYIAALDYAHLDNGMFLASVAKALARQSGVRSILVHGDSAYTERLIQTGIMREEARIRAVKDLNHRLVALFADHRVSVVGLNSYQKNFVTHRDGELKLDHDHLKRLPREPVLLLSNLIYDRETEKTVFYPLPEFVSFLNEQLQAEEVFLFSTSAADEVFTENRLPEKKQWDDLDESFKNNYLPEEFSGWDSRVRLITARDFGRLPELSRSMLIY